MCCYQICLIRNNTSKKVKTKPTECKKILTYHISHKGLISRYTDTKNVYNSKKKKTHAGFYKEQRNLINILPQRRHTNGQQVHTKMLNISNDQRLANQSHEISPHTCQNGIIKWTRDKKCWPKYTERRILVHCW